QEENRGEPARDLCKHVGGLGAEDIFGYAPTESRAEAFAFRPLHQDDEHHEHSDKDINPQENVNQKGHLGRAISSNRTEKQTPNAERRTSNAQCRLPRCPTRRWAFGVGRSALSSTHSKFHPAPRVQRRRASFPCRAAPLR